MFVVLKIGLVAWAGTYGGDGDVVVSMVRVGWK